MFLECGALSEWFTTLATAERLLSGVDHIMTFEIVTRAKGTMAERAGIGASIA